MKQSKIVPLVTLKKEQLSIVDISNLVINFFRRLENKFDEYGQINIISEKTALYKSIDVKNILAIELLAKEILNQNIEDIIKQDGENNPNIHFQFKNSLVTFSIGTWFSKETLITLNFCFTRSKSINPSIGAIIVNQIVFDSFEKIKYFLEVCVSSFHVKHCTIKLNDRELNKKNRTFKAHLGLITYFSNDFEIPIPNDLEGIEYEFTEKGKYLSVISKEDFREEDMELYKAKLIDVMNQISIRVPAYFK
jgi:hypothetical protein